MGWNTHNIIILNIKIDPIIGAPKDQIEMPADFAAAISKLLFNLTKVSIEPNKNIKGKNEKIKNGTL